MHPQLTHLRRAFSSISGLPLGPRLVRDCGSFSRSHIGLRQASQVRAVDPVATVRFSLRLQVAPIVPSVQSLLRACTGKLVAGGASQTPNYVLNRTVGDMLRSNQTISALGRLARR
jgi:hypothetical protein